MLRLREWLEFKPEDSAGKFEVLVTTGHDRIFGDMVKQQRMEARKKEEIEYYKKKKAQKEKAEKEAKEKKEAGGDGEKGEPVEEDKEAKEKSDTSTKKVKDGVEVADKVKDANKHDHKAEEDDVKLMVAIPVKTDGVKDGDLDAKHDRVAVLAGPGEAAAAAKAEVKDKPDNKGEKEVGEGEKDKKVRDPLGDAEKIAKMMGKTGNLKMEDIQIALKVLEAASGMSCPLPSLASHQTN
jgi:hypothetical protein